MKKLHNRIALLCIIFFLNSAGKLSAQPPWSIGVGFYGNILQGDFSSHPLFFSGDIYAKYDLNNWISLCAGFSLGELKMSLDANERIKISYPEKIRVDYYCEELYAAITVYKTG